ncbi:hypothetical protein Q5P01_003322 [Channa striata]|uniref:Uncharacterized protein n=1 Tax=Channa striata TaxID=64152 RepID=A0AA88NJH0_CHASR|nr:hypothetical protein Q5P01_003322 [Channa striata]
MDGTGEVQAPASTSEKAKRQPSSRKLKRKFSGEEEEAPQEENNRNLGSLRRGSSFTFLPPGPQWDFSLKRKHRGKDDSDAISLCSFDFKMKLYRISLFCLASVGGFTVSPSYRTVFVSNQGC